MLFTCLTHTLTHFVSKSCFTKIFVLSFAMKTKHINLTVFLILVVYRLFGVYCIQSSFVPDEYWQSLEVAHNLTFGYGHITWEWQTQIRSCTYPLLISLLYQVLPETRFVLTQVPRLAQAILTALGDFFAYRLSFKLFGRGVSQWMLFNLLTSWFIFYCAPRTLTNMAETSFTAIGLYYYPWNIKEGDGRMLNYLWFAGLATMMRPTGVIIWIPLYLWHVWRKRKTFLEIAIKTVFIGSSILAALILIDCWCYKHWVLTPYQFFLSNWSNDIGAFYGSQSWFWYFAVGFPVIMSVQIIPFVMGISVPRLKQFYLLVLWVIGLLSQLSHKEFRFLLPILHISLMISAFISNEISRKRVRLLGLKIPQNASAVIAAFTLLTNVPLSIYTGFYHQRGVVDVTLKLSEMITEDSSVLFLMPCHSTPYYSYIHRNITMKILTCEPNLDKKENYIDEADIFYNEPKDWLHSHFGNFYHEERENSCNNFNTLPSHIVMFDILYSHISEFLVNYNYVLCYSTFHTHFADSRIGKNAQIYCKNRI